MNKKGMTLMEVLVSLVLISIVMIFIVNLLSDLKNEGILSNKRNEDSLTRASLINVIEADLINTNPYLVSFIKNCDQVSNKNTKTCYQFVFQNTQNNSTQSKYLYINSNFIAYGPTNSMEKWELNYGIYDVDNISISFLVWSIKSVLFPFSNSSSNVPSVLAIHIPVIGVDASAKNKFDIELTALSSVGQFGYKICNGNACTEQEN